MEDSSLCYHISPTRYHRPRCCRHLRGHQPHPAGIPWTWCPYRHQSHAPHHSRGLTPPAIIFIAPDAHADSRSGVACTRWAPFSAHTRSSPYLPSDASLPAPRALPIVFIPLAEPAPSFLPNPRTQHQKGWDLCHECKKHYHQKSYFHCRFCHFK
jgi:hypothetical protein